MSLLPFLFDESELCRPTRMADRNWGLLHDLVQPVAVPRSLLNLNDYFKNLNVAMADNSSTVSYDKNKFQANFDVQHFKPEEICVKVTGDNTVTIECKHEEKQDEHGHIYRHFLRKYTIPKDCDMNKLESKLSSDGVLSISAPRVGEPIENRAIPVIQTGQPAKSIKNTATKEPEKK